MDALTEKVLEAAVDVDDDGKNNSRDESQKMKLLRQYLKYGTYPEGLSKNAKRVIRKSLDKGQYECEGKSLFYITHVRKYNRTLKKRLLVVTDRKEKMRLIWQCHTADHGAVNVTQEKLATTYYWRGMKDDVKRYVETCDICQRWTNLVTWNKNGVVTFKLKSGDIVLRQNLLRNVGMMDPRWLGPYTIISMDDNQLVQLQLVGEEKPLPVQYPYDQLKPYLMREEEKEREPNQDVDMQDSPAKVQTNDKQKSDTVIDHPCDTVIDHPCDTVIDHPYSKCSKVDT